MTANAPFALDRLARAEPLAPGLRGTSFRPARGLYARFTHLLLVRWGDVAITTDEIRHDIEGPAAAVLPPEAATVVELAPGTAGWVLGMAPSILSDALGTGAEAELLGSVTAQLTLLRDFRPSPGLDADVFAARIRAEITDGAPGSHMALLACLRLVLVEIWRRGGFDAPELGQGDEMHVLRRFRRLVELRFRTPMTIAEYARQLGLSYERLHRICQRNLGRPPLRLVHQRKLREAELWLEQSGRSVGQIAQTLGFAEPSEFSHFFRRASGLSPSAFRARARASSGDTQRTPTSFSDWP